MLRSSLAENPAMGMVYLSILIKLSRAVDQGEAQVGPHVSPQVTLWEVQMGLLMKAPSSSPKE